MIIHFLSAKQHLAKTFSADGTVQPYPHASDFTSIETNINNIEALYSHIIKYGEQGYCLIKGTLTRSLHNESRAGSTHPSIDTRLLVLDIDRCPPEITTPQEFIAQCLPEEFQSASYIWQWSNSAKITKHCLAGHFFFLLSQEISPAILKNTLTYYNLTNEILKNQIKLSANGLSLTYGLDVTCAQNDKLIFIAPPILKNIADPFPKNRISLHTREKTPFLTLNTNIPFPTIETLKQEILNKLRQEIGLPRKKEKYKNDVLVNPERAIFRGPYIHARDFVYGNLNNGDSYAYFHKEHNPDILYNFKGEPNVYLKDIDPDYWQSLQPTTVNTKTTYHIFRERCSDVYYTLIYNEDKTYTLNVVSNLQKAQSFLRLHHTPVPDEAPIWDMCFAPDENYEIDFANQKINTYQKTEYLKHAQPSPIRPTKFQELLLHVVGSDMEMFDDILNWLAYIIQKRTMSRTAVILHGRTGTGKGVLFTKVIQPILGPQYCPQLLLEDLDKEFNDAFINAIVVMFDEAQIREAANRTRRRINKIKNYITEPDFLIKKKYANAVTVKSHMNFIFASNEHDSFILDEQDRRFKVCPRQEYPLNYNKKDIEQLTNELQAITNYLIGYNVNETRATNVTHNTAKQQLIEATRYGINEFIHILKTGDLAPLLDAQDNFPPPDVATYQLTYTQLIQTWTKAIGQELYISIDNLNVVYNYMSGERLTNTKFGRYLKQYGFVSKVVRVNDKITRAIPVTWHLSEEYLLCSQPLDHTPSSPSMRNVHTH